MKEVLGLCAMLLFFDCQADPGITIEIDIIIQEPTGTGEITWG